MIIDDAQCMCHLYDFLLRRHLCNIATTLFFTKKAGVEALKSLDAGYSPDFAILDLKINGVTGIDIWKKLKEKVPNPSFIFLTATDESQTEFKEALSLVNKDLVVKKTEINFFEDIMKRIPNVEKYLKCTQHSCINGGDPSVCKVRLKEEK